MNGVHSNSMQDFRELVYKLDPIQALQQNTIISGEFANAITNTGLDFTQTELDLSELVLEVNKLARLSERIAACYGRIMQAIEIASAKLEGEEVLTEITLEVDIAAVAEGGFNPIADIIGLILTIIDGALIIGTIEDLADEIYQAIKDLKDDFEYLKNVIYPPTAPQPYAKNIQPKWKDNPKPSSQQITDVINELKQKGFWNKFDIKQQAELQGIIADLLQMGMSKDQITEIMGLLLNSGSSPADILLFLRGLLNSDGSKPDSPTLDAIVKRIRQLANAKPEEGDITLKQVVDEYAKIAAISGAGRLLERLITASYANGNFHGYFFEMQWIAAHKDDVARIEDVTLNSKGNPTQAADVVMNSGPFTKGAIVDTKNWTWPVSQKRFDGMIKQVEKDQKDYPGYPIVYVFNSEKGEVPANVIKALTDAGVTVMSSPPDKVLGVGKEDLPNAHTNPAKLLESASNVATGIIEAGQSQGQPQLPPGQTEPPQQLPPMQLPPQK